MPGKPDVAFFGDSITHVLDVLRRKREWDVDAWFPGMRVEFRGKSGATVDGVADLLGSQDELRRDASVLVVWAGTNDLGKGRDPAPALDRLLARLGGGKDKVVVVQAILPRTSTGVGAANAAIRRVCQRRGATFADCGGDLDPSDPAIMPDGLHPTPAGYARVFRCLAPLLRKALAGARAEDEKPRVPATPKLPEKPRAAPTTSKPPTKPAPPKPKKPLVGLFVSTWHDLDPPGGRKVQAPDADGSWTPKRWYWWGRPAWGGGDLSKYTWTDPEMADYHARNFAALGVDFVYLDFTNGRHAANVAGAHALCAALGRAGGRTKVAFWVRFESDAGWYRREFYDRYPDLVQRFRGQPLLLVAGTADGYVPRAGTIRPLPDAPGFTARWMWGLMGDAMGSMWSFKDVRLPEPFVRKTKTGGATAEHMGLSFACQASGMSIPGGGRRCRDGGKWFARQAALARKHRPEVVTVTGYNEWMAINLSDDPTKPLFIDLWKEACSHDVEPMRGGHGTEYFDQLREFVKGLR